MRVALLLSTFAFGLSLAQTSYDNGLWNPSTSVWQPTPTTTIESLVQSTTAYQSWTTWTSMVVYGTVTVTVTSTAPCPTTPTTTIPQAPVIVTTTQYTTTQCNQCRPVTTCYACQPVYTTSYWNGYGYSTSTTVTATTVTLTTSTPTTVTTASASLTTQQRPVTTVTSGTVVYVVYGSGTTAAAAGQVTTNGVVQVISAASTREDADVMKATLAMVVAVLALVVI